MMVAPSLTPDAIVAKLHREIVAIVTLPEIETEILKLGMLRFENTSVDGLREFVKSEIVRWGKVVEQAGITHSE